MACVALGCPWGGDPGYPLAVCGRKRKYLGMGGSLGQGTLGAFRFCC